MSLAVSALFLMLAHSLWCECAHSNHMHGCISSDDHPFKCIFSEWSLSNLVGHMPLKCGSSHIIQTWSSHTIDPVNVCAGALQALRLQVPDDQQGESVRSVLYKLTH